MTASIENHDADLEAEAIEPLHQACYCSIRITSTAGTSRPHVTARPLLQCFVIWSSISVCGLTRSLSHVPPWHSRRRDLAHTDHLEQNVRRSWPRWASAITDTAGTSWTARHSTAASSMLCDLVKHIRMWSHTLALPRASMAFSEARSGGLRTGPLSTGLCFTHQ
jgi:hypothetical protein